MTPERATRLVALWVRFYTRGLPEPMAGRRIDEITVDLSDQIEYERAVGIGDSRIAFNILSRLARGVAADASWRSRHLAPPERKPVLRPVLAVLCATALLLSIPLVAMQFTHEVLWSPADFAVAGGLLGGTGLLFVLVTRATGGAAYKLGAAIGLGACLLLVWASLSVGILGAEGDPADLMYLGVLSVGAVGSALARLRPAGMSLTLLAMALAQMVVAAIALLAGKHQAAFSSAVEILALNAFFAALFLGSAALFRIAGRRESHRLRSTAC